MAHTAGPSNAGTGANFNDGGDTAWTNPGNAAGAQNGTNATVSLAKIVGGTIKKSQRLRLSNFGFGIPTTATILGILAEPYVSGDADANGDIDYDSVKLTRPPNADGTGAATEVGTDKSTGVALGAAGYDSFGGAADLWGTTFTPAQVNAAGFGVSLKVLNSSTLGTLQGRVDAARITITYKDRPEGTAVRSETLTISAAGTRRRVGTASRAETLAIAVAGVRRLVGTAARSETLAIAVAGVRRLVGTAVRSETLAIAVAGVRRLVGTAVRSETLTITAEGTRVGVGSATFGVVCEIECEGTMRAYGAAELATELELEAAGVRRATGTATLPIAIDYTVPGDRRAVGAAELGLIFGTEAHGESMTIIRGRVGSGRLAAGAQPRLAKQAAGTIDRPVAGRVEEA